MKQSPEERRLAERMAPGVLARNGFLAEDRRPLSDILDADRSAVAGLGVSHERLAAELAKALAEAVKGLGVPVTVRGHLTVIYREAMGRIPCPWGDAGTFPKGEVELVDNDTGERLCFTPLSVHLVGRHGFYEGRGSRYRLEPAMLCHVFGL